MLFAHPMIWAKEELFIVMPDAKSVIQQLRSNWIEAMKNKSEDSKIYSFLKSRVLEASQGKPEEDISDYFALKALAQAKVKSVALHDAICKNPAAASAINRVKREISIIDSFIPEAAKEEDVDVALVEAFFSLEESGEALLLDSVMKIMAQRFAGRYPASRVKAKAERYLVSKL